MLSNCSDGEDSWESLGQQGDQTNPSSRKSTLNIHWKGWCWRWNFNTLATWCEELTHWKRPWCWERLRAGGEGDDKGWDSWMASLTRWTRVWANSRRWWWTGKPGVRQSVGSQRVGHNLANEQQHTFWDLAQMLLNQHSWLSNLEICDLNQLSKWLWCSWPHKQSDEQR